MSIRATDGHRQANPQTALEAGFPAAQISALAERESWRKEINRPPYHIHKWWATRLGSVFRGVTLGALTDADSDIWRSFYERHDLKDKVVLDPFMGSGTTLGEALKLGARAIGCDINPVSTFLVRQALTQIDERDLQKAFAYLEATVAPEIRRYYETVDPDTGRRIPALYFFWCKTVTTPKGEVIPLFSRYVFAQHTDAPRKPTAWAVCPACWQVFSCQYDAARAQCPHCRHDFDPQDGPAKGEHVRDHDGALHRIKDLLPKEGEPPRHRLYAVLALRADGQKIYLAARHVDRALYAKAEARLARENLPLPTMTVRPGHNTNQARGYNYHHWRDFFNSRQLLCLGLLLKGILRIPDERVREQMLCLFSSTLEFNNLFCSYKGEGTGAVRHMFSHHILKPERAPLENSVWGTDKSSGTFSTLFGSRLLRAKRYLREPFELKLGRDLLGGATKPHKVVSSGPLAPQCVETWSELQSAPQAVMVLNGDSARLPLPDMSVDAIVTDPPYFDFIHYSELSDFFFAWLAGPLAGRYPWMKRTNSSAEGEVQARDPRVFAQRLGRVFAECHRVVRPNGILAFSFHHSRPEGWAAIHAALQDAGFGVVAAHIVHGELRVSSPKAAARDPITLDAILVCREREKHTAKGRLPKPLGERVARTTDALAQQGVKASRGDQFVIAAAQTLIDHRASSRSYEEVVERLSVVRDEVMNGAHIASSKGSSTDTDVTSQTSNQNES